MSTDPGAEGQQQQPGAIASPAPSAPIAPGGPGAGVGSIAYGSLAIANGMPRSMGGPPPLAPPSFPGLPPAFPSAVGAPPAGQASASASGAAPAAAASAQAAAAGAIGSGSAMGSGVSPAVSSGVAAAPAMTPYEVFEGFCRKREIGPEDARNLYDVLSRTRVGVLVDDSSSMNAVITPEGSNAFAAVSTANAPTRWSEATKLLVNILQIVTAAKPSAGVDVEFMNRPSPNRPVHTLAEVAAFFQAPPDGGTPMLKSLRRIFRARAGRADGEQYLLVIVTDGEPTDGSTVDQSVPELRQLLGSKPGNVHVSMVECTDQKETMDYLEAWNSVIPKFDNTEAYAEELIRIRAIQRNPNFKFTYNDYVVKILLATFIRRYFAVDMMQIGSGAPTANANLPPAAPLYAAPSAYPYGQSNYGQSNYGQSNPLPPAAPYIPPASNSDDCCCCIL